MKRQACGLRVDEVHRLVCVRVAGLDSVAVPHHSPHLSEQLQLLSKLCALLLQFLALLIQLCLELLPLLIQLCLELLPLLLQLLPLLLDLVEAVVSLCICMPGDARLSLLQAQSKIVLMHPLVHPLCCCCTLPRMYTHLGEQVIKVE